MVGETGFVVEVRVSEVDIAVGFAVVELDGDGVVGVLVYSPYESNHVQTEIPPFVPPWRGGGLEWLVDFGGPETECPAFGVRDCTGVKVGYAALLVQGRLSIPATIVVNKEIIVRYTAKVVIKRIW